MRLVSSDLSPFSVSWFLTSIIFLGIVCTFLTFTMNLFIDFVPTYSEKKSVIVNTEENNKPNEEEEKKKLLPIVEETEGTENEG
jgi:hypothetical protein